MRITEKHHNQLGPLGLSLLHAAIVGQLRLYSPCHMGPGTQFTVGALGAFSYIYCLGELHFCDIGNYTSIAKNCTILQSHPLDRLSTSTASYGAWGGFAGQCPLAPHLRTYIGSDVWIGANVGIKAGVRIGDGVVIGAGAVVTKDIPPYVITGGVPAKVIRPRFAENFAQRALESRWFDYDWRNIELPWGDAEATLIKMEEKLTTEDVPRITHGYECLANEEAMKMRPITQPHAG